MRETPTSFSPGISPAISTACAPGTASAARTSRRRILAWAWGAQTGQTLTEDDAQAIAAEIDEVVVAAPSSRKAVQAVVGNQNWATTMVGTTADYLTVRDWPLDPALLTPPQADARQWATVLQGQALDTLLAAIDHNTGDFFFRHEGQVYNAYLVPWLPGADYTDEVGQFVIR